MAKRIQQYKPEKACTALYFYGIEHTLGENQCNLENSSSGACWKRFVVTCGINLVSKWREYQLPIVPWGGKTRRTRGKVPGMCEDSGSSTGTDG